MRRQILVGGHKLAGPALRVLGIHIRKVDLQEFIVFNDFLIRFVHFDLVNQTQKFVAVRNLQFIPGLEQWKHFFDKLEHFEYIIPVLFGGFDRPRNESLFSVVECVYQDQILLESFNQILKEKVLSLVFDQLFTGEFPDHARLIRKFELSVWIFLEEVRLLLIGGVICESHVFGFHFFGCVLLDEFEGKVRNILDVIGIQHVAFHHILLYFLDFDVNVFLLHLFEFILQFFGRYN
mmetsp:Transcript_55113/g.120161  ORF Transcript_55113/g.120161 Transcript_55113/m.120161 type:complete len:235 (-) Transcript_55113:1291-1995(-)